MPADEQIPAKNHKKGNFLPTIQKRSYLNIQVLVNEVICILLLKFVEFYESFN